MFSISQEKEIKVIMKAAGGIVFRRDPNERISILLIKRSPDDHFPNFFEFPRGKCDKKGENIIQCLKREVKEETDLDITPVGLIDTFEYLADEGERKTICFNFLVSMNDKNQEIKLSKEHSEYRWVSTMGEIENLCFPDQTRAISKVLNSDYKYFPENTFTKNNSVDESCCE